MGVIRRKCEFEWILSDRMGWMLSGRKCEFNGSIGLDGMGSSGRKCEFNGVYRIGWDGFYRVESVSLMGLSGWNLVSLWIVPVETNNTSFIKILL